MLKAGEIVVDIFKVKKKKVGVVIKFMDGFYTGAKTC